MTMSAYVVATVRARLRTENARLSPRTNRLPRAAEVEAREKRDPQYKAEMANARRYLAETFCAEEPNSLTKLRLQRGLSQSALAKLVGTSQPHIAKIEAGTLRIYWETATRLADALQVSLEELRPLIKVASPATEFHAVVELS
jgi:DNA-binding XRE family transcriptional regulator